MAQQNIMGYALTRKDWINIEKTCLTELTQSFKYTAMRKYFEQWQALDHRYFPRSIKWYKDKNNEP